MTTRWACRPRHAQRVFVLVFTATSVTKEKNMNVVPLLAVEPLTVTIGVVTIVGGLLSLIKGLSNK